jgi:hypothetical protein
MRLQGSTDGGIAVERILVLANTAHAGGRLVHELGVRATVSR